MSCGGARLQIAAKHQNEIFAAHMPAGPQQISTGAHHSYQRQQQQQQPSQQQPHRHLNQYQQQQPHQLQQQQQQQQQQQLLLLQLQLQQSQQPPETASTNTNATRLATVQSKRKEKARIAARARRSQEANIIMEMAGELCISQEKLRRIDKATIVKLAIDYIRAHGVLCNSAPAPSLCSHPKQLKNSHNNQIDELQRQQQRHPIQTHYGYVEDFDGGAPQQRQHLDERQLAANEEEEENEEKREQQYQQQPRADDDDEEPEEETVREIKEEPAASPPLEQPLYSAPKLSTASIFAPRTVDNMNPHFLMIEEKDNGKGAFVLKPDAEILDDDDLTHLAPQAGDISISLEVEPLEGIPWEDLLIPSPVSVQQQLWMR